MGTAPRDFNICQVRNGRRLENWRSPATKEVGGAATSSNDHHAKVLVLMRASRKQTATKIEQLNAWPNHCGRVGHRKRRRQTCTTAAASGFPNSVTWQSAIRGETYRQSPATGRLLFLFALPLRADMEREGSSLGIVRPLLRDLLVRQFCNGLCEGLGDWKGTDRMGQPASLVADVKCKPNQTTPPIG